MFYDIVTWLEYTFLEPSISLYRMYRYVLTRGTYKWPKLMK